ncbi:MAG TPA: glutathione S-transferase [Rheinheimera sp.]|nr:glutathione S-transferase [Rheinheimera sp.]
MKLYGSIASPFVRRLRIALYGQDFEFVALNIFEAAGREELIRLNPTRKVPMLEDQGTVIFDSGVIYRYLVATRGLPALTWQQENNLTTINAANDSLVELLLCQRSGFDTKDDRLFFNLQRERVQATLAILDQKVAAGEFKAWDYVAQSLYCLVDWAAFRQLADLTPFTNLLDFVAAHAQRAEITSTDPRLA